MVGQTFPLIDLILLKQSRQEKMQKKRTLGRAEKATTNTPNHDTCDMGLYFTTQVCANAMYKKGCSGQALHSIGHLRFAWSDLVTVPEPAATLACPVHAQGRAGAIAEY